MLRLDSGEGLHTHATVLRRSSVLASRLDQQQAPQRAGLSSFLVVHLPHVTLAAARGALFFLYTGLLPPEPKEASAASTPDQSVYPAHAFAAPLSVETLAHVAVELQSQEMAQAILARYGSAGDAGLPSSISTNVAEGLGRLLSKSLSTKAVPPPLLRLQAGMPASSAWSGLVWLDVEGTRLPADRAVLATRSEYFSASLHSYSQGSQNGPAVLAMPPGISVQSVQHLLVFLELDSVDLSNAGFDDLLDLLVLARYTLLFRSVSDLLSLTSLLGKGSFQNFVQRLTCCGSYRLNPCRLSELAESALVRLLDLRNIVSVLEYAEFYCKSWQQPV